MQQKNKASQDKKKFAKGLHFFLLSFALHITIGLAILITSKRSQTSQIKNQIPIEVTLQTEDPPAQQETDSPKNMKLTNLKSQQVVQTDEAQSNEELNPNAKYLSAKNNSIQKETVAKNIGQFKNSQREQKSITPKNKVPSVADTKTANSNSKEILKSKLFDTGFDAYASLNKNEFAKKQAQKEHSFKNGTTQDKDSQTNDHLENVEPSLMTQLNTREYKYYGYHKRIRTQLDQWYETQLRHQLKKIMSQGRTIASDEGKRTQLLIILNDKGTLVKIQIMGASGVRELDDAAVDAFRKAAPFPNPPRGMIDNDGTIKVRWDFVLS